MPCLTGTAAHPAGCARLSAFHRGSRPRDFRRQRLSARPGFLGRGEQVWPIRRAGVTRPNLSQSSDSTSRAGHSAGRLMPKAARERVASPPAGTAYFAPAPEPAGPSASELEARTVTDVNRTVTVIFDRHPEALGAKR